MGNLVNGSPNQIEPVSIPEVYYSDIEDGWSGAGSNNQDVDPEFAAYTDCLVPLDSGSPIINDALATYIPLDTLDIDGDGNTTERLPDLNLLTRVVGGSPDIGAREDQ